MSDAGEITTKKHLMNLVCIAMAKLLVRFVMMMYSKNSQAMHERLLTELRKRRSTRILRLALKFRHGKLLTTP